LLVSQGAMLRFFLQKLLNDPRVIDKLADSPPVRQAAKATARVILRAQLAAKEAGQSQLAQQASEFKDQGVRAAGMFKDQVAKEIEQGTKGFKKPPNSK